ncbi:MAG: AI-2E family transporter [Candidatus Doudnabacteria bacterium]|nr:AI-2E family transporter [Candidatus Doudnabacteria bacterium]
MASSGNKIQNISFYILFAIVGLTVALMFLPFFELIALGGILAVLFSPVKLKISKNIKSESLASAITLIIALILVIVPVYGIGQLVFNEIVNVYTQQASQGSLAANLNNFVSHLSGPVQGVAQNILNNISAKASAFAGNAFQSLTDIAANIAGFILDVILVAFTFYYLLKDGSRLRAFIERIFPLEQSHEALLVKKLEMAINGVVQGSFTVALLQGAASTVGFIIFGVSQPLLWGVFTVLASLVPTVGTLLSLIPAIAYLFISGHTGAAVGMTIWAFVTIQGIGNFISPKLIGYKTNLHPLVTLLSILGGLVLFGYLGFLIGPILMAMFMALVDIYSGKDKELVTK